MMTFLLTVIALVMTPLLSLAADRVEYRTRYVEVCNGRTCNLVAETYPVVVSTSETESTPLASAVLAVASTPSHLLLRDHPVLFPRIRALAQTVNEERPRIVFNGRVKAFLGKVRARAFGLCR